MYDLPPPPAIISTMSTQYIDVQIKDILVISVDKARYDAIAKTAILDLEEAFGKSREIMAHKGGTIALIYQNHIKTDDIRTCPKVRVPYSDIERDIQFAKNTVTLTISNIGQGLADKIRDSQCLNVDSYTVKKVVNPDFDKKPEHSFNP